MATQVVLVVDDEPSVRQFLSRWLEGWGYVVKQASNATEALEVMFAEPASIILCDIRMPGMTVSGLSSACEQMASDGHHHGDCR